MEYTMNKEFLKKLYLPERLAGLSIGRLVATNGDPEKIAKLPNIGKRTAMCISAHSIWQTLRTERPIDPVQCLNRLEWLGLPFDAAVCATMAAYSLKTSRDLVFEYFNKEQYDELNS